LNRSISSVFDEIKRNSVKGEYDPKKANDKARIRRQEAKYQGMKIVRDGKLQKTIEKLLYDDQTPEAIAGKLRKGGKDISWASKDSIYRYIKSPYGRKIEVHRKKRKKYRIRKRPRICKLKDRTFIDKRPIIINARKRIGDTEADFVVSGRNGKGILLVVVCRKTRVAFIEQITRVNIENVHLAFQRIKLRFPEMKTITIDNDILLQKHKELEAILDVKIYFCHPYHSWEKGTVENINKHIRKYIPKGSDLSKYSKSFIRRLEAKLNRRIMKVIDFNTPEELVRNYRKQKNA
jgi:IS30 family transposase